MKIVPFGHHFRNLRIENNWQLKRKIKWGYDFNNVNKKIWINNNVTHCIELKDENIYNGHKEHVKIFPEPVIDVKETF